MRAGRKKLPAFGRQVLQLRREGLAPSGWLRVSRRWPRYSTAWHIVVPAGDDPSQYDMSVCAGLAVLVSADHGDNSNAVLVSLIETARPAIRCIVIDDEFSDWIKPQGAG